MGRNDRWTSTGPDAYDVHAFLTAVEQHHQCACHFELRIGTSEPTRHRLQVKLVALPGPGPELFRGPLKPLHVEDEWPSSRYRSLEILMYRLLWQLDGRLSTEWWEQKELPF